MGERLFSGYVPEKDGLTLLPGSNILAKGGGHHLLYNRKTERSDCLPKPVKVGKIMGYRFLRMFVATTDSTTAESGGLHIQK